MRLHESHDKHVTHSPGDYVSQQLLVVHWSQFIKNESVPVRTEVGTYCTYICMYVC